MGLLPPEQAAGPFVSDTISGIAVPLSPKKVRLFCVPLTSDVVAPAVGHGGGHKPVEARIQFCRGASGPERSGPLWLRCRGSDDVSGL